MARRKRKTATSTSHRSGEAAGLSASVAVDLRAMVSAAADAVCAGSQSPDEVNAKLELLRKLTVVVGAVYLSQGNVEKTVETAGRFAEIPHMAIGGPASAAFVVHFLSHMIETGETLPEWHELFCVSQVADSLDCVEQEARETIRRLPSSQEPSGGEPKARAAQIVLGTVTRVRELLEMDDYLGALANVLVLLAHAPSHAVITARSVRLGGERGRARSVRSRRDGAADEIAGLLKDVGTQRERDPTAGPWAIAEELLPLYGGSIDHTKPGAERLAIDALRKKIERAEKAAAKAKKKIRGQLDT